MLRRIIDSGLQAPLLLVFGNVQEDLHNRGPLLRQHPLEFGDVALAAFPDLVRKELFHPHGDDVLVVAAIENNELAGGRHLGMHPPQEVVGELFRARLLEGIYMDPLRIDARENVLDAAVLAAGVHGLHHHQDAVLVLRVEFFLKCLELVLELVELRFEVVLATALEQRPLAAVDFRQVHFVPRLHQIPFQSSNDWHEGFSPDGRKLTSTVCGRAGACHKSRVEPPPIARCHSGDVEIQRSRPKPSERQKSFHRAAYRLEFGLHDGRGARG